MRLLWRISGREKQGGIRGLSECPLKPLRGNNMELIFDEEEFIVEEVIDDGKHLSCSDEKIQTLLDHPDDIGRMVGFKDLTADLHREWIREMVYGERDYTLQAHRGSYKSSCLAVAIALLLVIDEFHGGG